MKFIIVLLFAISTQCFAVGIPSFDCSGLENLVDANTLLLDSAKSGDFVAAQRALFCGADPNAQRYGYSALMWAIHGSDAHPEIATMLLDNPKIQVDLRDSGGSSMLMWTFSFKWIDISYVTTLMNKGAHILARNDNGETALFFAIDSGDISRVKFVINSLPPYVTVVTATNQMFFNFLNTKNLNGTTALDEAKKRNMADIVQYLQSLGAR